MNRRQFLKTLATGSALLYTPAASRLWALSDAQAIKTVYLVFKTHLDVGYTDLAANVIHRYFDDFIPRALDLAAATRQANPQERFLWTTGSWLVYRYLEQASAPQRRRMEQAIEAGDLVWHALPFTTHTEILDQSLMELALGFSAALDKRFGRKTTAAKMTDVPGHTRSMVSPLARAGIRFLHIGDNPGSMPPDVPPLFIWRDTDGAQITVLYQKDYGGTMPLPHSTAAVAINLTGDNHGPQSPQQVSQIYQNLRRQFPNATVIPATLDMIADAVAPLRDQLPIVTQEIGDTWIHGPASDPKLIAQFRELGRLRKTWLANGKLALRSATDLAFGSHLLLIPEHTWGLDIKTYLRDWDIYEPAPLQAALSKPNFQKTEASWVEKRANLTAAIASLPENLAAEARQHLDQLRPAKPNFAAFTPLPNPAAEIQTEHFIVALDPVTGALRRLCHKKTGREWAAPERLLAQFTYQSFSAQDYDRFFNQYLTQKVDWTLGDFGKPGLDRIKTKSATWTTRLTQALVSQDRTGHRILVEMQISPDKDQQLPAAYPRQLTLELFLPANEPTLHLDFQWFDKPANRLPEAMWLSFCPIASNAAGWTLDKMNRPVSPLDVVANGNRHLHAVSKGVTYTDPQGTLAIDTFDAPLVAPGQESLLDFNNTQPDMRQGIHFNLYNNIWGTNFRMWFNEDMRFRFALRF